VFAPQRTVQTSIPGGGVRAEARPIEPATITGPDISSPTGLSSFPNVNLLADIPQVECPFLHVVDVLCPEQAACTTFAVVWAPDPGTERDFWSRQLG